MPMLVMHVGHMRMLVSQPHMRVEMGVRFARRVFGPMGVLMMLVVNVSMRMCHRFMPMLMFVMFGQVQPHAERHEQAGRDELEGHGLA